ncbi:AraC family transcriptional regulator [Amycolatopsis sp.]|uniref:AraC family transcriptional regulator n=1 Tax=Amycolatopsis sp. TaxID=37632 RepID=UPI002CA514B9|nr:AraC family transcriptional regulator [Amycolatopsis sp.]HVV13279.1 AraC family transcriptional regulator [Amycolatopsis sp.]
MDVLSDAIAAMRTGSPHSSRQQLRPPWRLRAPEFAGAGFHVVLQGSLTLTVDGQPVRLGPGDVALLPHGAAHELADTAAGPATSAELRLERDGEPAEQIDRNAPTVLLCGAYLLNRVRVHPLLDELPAVIHLPARLGRHPSLRAAIDLLGTEMAEPRPGGEIVVPALLDTLLLYILRAWYAEQPAATGWAAALSDPAVSAALLAIHRDPAHPWTVEELGTRAGLSRAPFARRFTTIAGQPPLRYLTWWRMTKAAYLLRRGDAPLRTIAKEVGYTSEFAFAKAFKREFGTAPGTYRASTVFEEPS